MRPPLNAGENWATATERSREPRASMRPPLNAGENEKTDAQTTSDCRRFNEAPAKRGGKHHRARSR